MTGKYQTHETNEYLVFDRMALDVTLYGNTVSQWSQIQFQSNAMENPYFKHWISVHIHNTVRGFQLIIPFVITKSENRVIARNLFSQDTMLKLKSRKYATFHIIMNCAWKRVLREDRNDPYRSRNSLYGRILNTTGCWLKMKLSIIFKMKL